MNTQNRVMWLAMSIISLTGLSVGWAEVFMGEYDGTYYPDGLQTMPASAKVVAEGDDVFYRIMITTTPGQKNQDGGNIELYGHRKGSTLIIADRAGGYYWHGQIQNDHLSVRSEYGQHFELQKISRKSPKEGLKPPQDAVVLLAFKEGVTPDMSAWTNAEWKALDNGAMSVNKGGNETKQHFGDIKHFHLEFKLPLEPNNRGQGRANSGVYFAGEFEVQVLDSFGLVHTSGDCGGLYNRARARVNACLPPETWQTYDVTFRAPRLNSDGTVRENPRITVIHNGITIQDDVEIEYSGDRWKGKSEATGPIHLQDHGHPVQYRNIWLVKGQ
ncbi:MAG: DUF1080 domain-containing protein [Phycisphaerae bacterium]|nr:DUF1080 domain-containing protein [Phycisphaerae bacterium]